MLDDNQKTYIDLVVCKIDRGQRYGIGAELAKRINGEYQIYKVASIYFDNKGIRSIYDAIQEIGPRLIDEVDQETKVIIFRSHISHFKYRERSLRSRWSILARDKGFNSVIIRRIPKLHKHSNSLQSLANDSIKRRGDCLSKI